MDQVYSTKALQNVSRGFSYLKRNYHKPGFNAVFYTKFTLLVGILSTLVFHVCGLTKIGK